MATLIIQRQRDIECFQLAENGRQRDAPADGGAALTMRASRK